VVLHNDWQLLHHPAGARCSVVVSQTAAYDGLAWRCQQRRAGVCDDGARPPVLLRRCPRFRSRAPPLAWAQRHHYWATCD
jgi:hypothetical protein